MDARIAPVRGVCCLLLLLLIGVVELRVSGAPVSAKNFVGEDERVAKNSGLNVTQNIVSTKQETAPSSSAISSSSSSSSEEQAAVPVKKSSADSKSEPAQVNRAPVPVRSVPVRSVPVNPVPGQIQQALYALGQTREGSRRAAAESEGRTISDEETEFLEDGDNLDAAAAELEGNQPWQYLLADPRNQDLMANSNQDRQRYDDRPSAPSESLNSLSMIDNLVRSGEMDRTLGDLVEAGVMTSDEATLYREAINLEYGSSPQSTRNDRAVADPEIIYEEAEPSDVLYDGPSYLQPVPVDYPAPASDYYNLASQPLQQQDENEDEQEEEEPVVRSDEDYQNGQSRDSRFTDSEEETEETNELLRDLLGKLALQDGGDRHGLSYKSVPAENEVQKPNSMSATSQLSSFERQYDNRDRGTAIEKELEALPSTGEGAQAPGTLEELELEEMRNRVRPEKTKQDNRTKPTKNKSR